MSYRLDVLLMFYYVSNLRTGFLPQVLPLLVTFFHRYFLRTCCVLSAAVNAGDAKIKWSLISRSLQSGVGDIQLKPKIMIHFIMIDV